MCALGLAFCLPTTLAGVLTSDREALEQQLAEQVEFESVVRAAFARGDYSGLIRRVEALQTGVVPTPGIRALHATALRLTGEGRSAGDPMLSIGTDPISNADARLIVDALRSAGNDGSVARFCERGLIGNPDDYYLLETLGRIRAEKGRHGVAVIYFEHALAMRTTDDEAVNARVLDELARSYLALFRYREAASLYMRYPDAGGELAELASLHGQLESGNADTAVSELEAAKLPVLFQARILLAAGLPERSLQLLKALESSGGQPAARMGMQIVAALAAGEPSQAKATLQRLEATLGAGSVDPVVYALTAAADGDVDGARSALQRGPAPLGDMAQQPEINAALSRPSDVPQLAIAYFRYQLGFYSLIGGGLAPATDVGVQSPLAQLLIADSARRQKQWQAALDGYQALAEQMPGAVSVRFFAAIVLDESGQREAAQAILAEVVEARPDFTLAQLTRVSLLQDLGRVDEAVETINWSLNFKPDSLPLHQALVGALIESGDADAAREALARLRKLSGQELVRLSSLDGKLALLEGKPERARAAFTEALRQNFESPDVMRNLADIDEIDGQARSGSGLRALAELFDAAVSG